MPQNNPDSDIQDAYEAFKAYKAFKAQQSKVAPDAADQAAQGEKPNAQPVSLVNNKNFPSSYSMGGMPAQAAQDNPEANKAFAKVGTGLAVGGLGALATEGMSGAVGLAARTAANAGGSGLQQYFGNLMDNKPATKGVGDAAMLGGGMSLGLEGAGALAGKFGDWAMQKSMATRGAKNYPGQGTALADAGVWGTKNMMANQVTRKLGDEEKNLKGIVGNLGGTYDSEPIAEGIMNRSQRFELPSTPGEAAPNMEGYLQKVKDAAESFRSQGEGGELTPQDLLAIKRQGDWLGYSNSGNPATSLEAELGRAQGDEARSILSNISDEATKNSLAKEQVLIRAKTQLDKPDTLSAGPMSLFSKMPGQGLIGSTGGQLGVKTGQGLSTIANPAVLQGLFGALKGSQ